MPALTDASHLESRLKRLEAELVAAKNMIVHNAEAANLTVGNLSPNSLFDRHGAIAIVFAIFIQTAGAIWWASGISYTVNNLQQGAQAREAAIIALAKTVQENANQLSRIQAVQEQVVKILDRHTQDFDRLYGPPDERQRGTRPPQ